MPVIGGLLGCSAGAGHGEGDRLMGRVQQMGGTSGGLQVVVDQAGDGGIALHFAAGVVGLLSGVGSQQVVKGVAAGEALGDQASAG